MNWLLVSMWHRAQGTRRKEKNKLTRSMHEAPDARGIQLTLALSKRA